MTELPTPPVSLVIPARSVAMEQRIPRVFHTALDNPATRLVLQRLIDTGAPAPGAFSTVRPIYSTVEKAYRRLCVDWLSCSGVAEAQMLEFDHDTRCLHAEAWLAARAPLYSAESLRQLKKALGWWADTHGVDRPLTAFASAIKGSKPGHGAAVPLDTTELVALLEGLHDERVLEPGPQMRAVLVQGWHRRMHASIAIAITCSLRTDSEAPQLELQGLSEDDVLGIARDGLVLRIGRTKPGQHRDIVLRTRNDLLCPLRALARWLEWCVDHQQHRPHGRLLPSVDLRKLRQPLGTAKEFDKVQWRRLTAFLERQGFDMTNKTLHGCRAVMPTAAVNSGVDHFRLRDLGGWKELRSAVRYARDHGINDVTSRLGQDDSL